VQRLPKKKNPETHQLLDTGNISFLARVASIRLFLGLLSLSLWDITVDMILAFISEVSPRNLPAFFCAVTLVYLL
jgi:hypothetical protein